MLSHQPGSHHAAHRRPGAARQATATQPPWLLTALLLALAVLLTVSLVRPAVAQEAAPLEVASGPLSERTLVFTGHTVQAPAQLQLFGFISRASGLTTTDLFTDDSGLVGAARLTFVADVAQFTPKTVERERLQRCDLSKSSTKDQMKGPKALRFRWAFKAIPTGSATRSRTE